MNDVVYNTIGTGYNTTRSADPYIADKLCELLDVKEGGQYLDIGCGTGNYLQAMCNRGVAMTGIDPSEIMLEEARKKNINAQLVCASSDNIPFPDGHFDGVMAVLTLHHWNDKQTGLQELGRVLKPGGSIVFFTFTPEQLYGYWLAHYFPKMIEQAANGIPGIATMTQMLGNAGLKITIEEPYFVREDLQDHFMYSHKYRPEQYLSQVVRDGASGFRLAKDKQEIEQGLQTLQRDIDSGAIHEVIARYENKIGDYLFLKAGSQIS